MIQLAAGLILHAIPYKLMGLPDWPLSLIGSHVSPLLFQDGQTRWFPVLVNDVLVCLAVSIAPAIYSQPIGGLHLRIT